MKILLLLPRLGPNTNPPLGLGYVAAYLRENDVEAEILDPTFEDKDWVLRRLARTDYHVLGISAYTMSFALGLEFARFAKSRNKESKVVFGGVHPTIMAEEVIKDKDVDFVVVGEGEETTLELLNALKNNMPLEEVRGLVFRKEKEIIRNPPRPLIGNLD